MPEWKQWAIGMSQQQFEREFCRRNGQVDFIPDVNVWLDEPEPERIIFNGVKPEDILMSDAEMPKQEEKMQSTSCRGCGRIFKMAKGAFLAKSAHERHCQIFKEKQLSGGL